eukprot:scaffold18940_cov87-Skeletonema_marinoi.AAC.2
MCVTIKKECNRDWLSDAKQPRPRDRDSSEKAERPPSVRQQPALSLVHLIYCTYPIGGDHTAYTPTALLHGAASRLVVLQKRHRHLSGLSDNFYSFVTYEFNAFSNNGSYELKSGLVTFRGRNF